MILSCTRNESSNVTDSTYKSHLLQLTFSFLHGYVNTLLHIRNRNFSKQVETEAMAFGILCMSFMKVMNTWEQERSKKETEREKKSVVIPLLFSSRSLPLQTPSGMSELQLRQTALTGMKVTVHLCECFIWAHPKKKKDYGGHLTDKLSHIFTHTPSCLLPQYVKTNMKYVQYTIIQKFGKSVNFLTLMLNNAAFIWLEILYKQ